MSDDLTRLQDRDGKDIRVGDILLRITRPGREYAGMMLYEVRQRANGRFRGVDLETNFLLMEADFFDRFWIVGTVNDDRAQVEAEAQRRLAEHIAQVKAEKAARAPVTKPGDPPLL